MLSRYERKQRTTPALDIRAGLAFAAVGQNVTFVSVTVTNVGEPAVTLEEIQVEMKGDSNHLSLISWYRVDDPLPKHLVTGQKWAGDF